MVPTDRRSSVSYPDCWYFLTTCATSRRFRLISTSLASRSPSLQRLKYSRSSCALSGFGNVFKESRLKLHYLILCGRICSGAFTISIVFPLHQDLDLRSFLPVSHRIRAGCSPFLLIFRIVTSIFCKNLAYFYWQEYNKLIL